MGAIVSFDWKCLPSGEHTWEHIVKQAGSVSSGAIGSVLESVLGSGGDGFECGHHMGWFRVESGGAACT